MLVANHQQLEDHSRLKQFQTVHNLFVGQNLSFSVQYSAACPVAQLTYNYISARLNFALSA